MADRGDRRYFDGARSSSSSSDDPPNSRLFIVCSKQLTEEDFREAFCKFGDIEEIWVVKDRNTGERKGVVYIKYRRTSEAAAALEAMNGKTLGNSNRHIKVMIAASKEQGSKREGNEEERVLRLFVIVSKSMTDEDLHDNFKQFGEIDYASVIRDKETKESKGFAYVKYFRFSHAAAAFENCDRKYRAVFAEPRRNKQSTEMDKYSSFDSSSTVASKPALNPLMGAADSTPEQHQGFTKLQVVANPMLNQDQLWKLFDVVPGMDFCNVRYEGKPRPQRAIANVVYNTHQWAAYAKEKLHGFEYPPGSRLIVKPDPDMQPQRLYQENNIGRIFPNPLSSRAKPLPSDLAQLAETIAQATSLIQAAGLTPGQTSRDSEPNYSNLKLPPPLPLADIDADTAARCFIVCSPHPPPIHALRDVFCRFGDLIDVYILANKNCGYAKYAKKESAAMAIKLLHGSEICGIRIKVLEAEEPRNNEDRRKRLKIDENL